ncbi:hypothetical protein B273_0322 [SAR86 cluster bacterium SAR86E]|uniref:Uncharacterized protein n=1 Tax=SAR86 cluster bacterium SAR86E TaxID=1208365 RepID=K6FF79_9GAMM|nr:hypothetical protein B273_0322 [SAR86 cluster bacterium SAR86E]
MNSAVVFKSASGQDLTLHGSCILSLPVTVTCSIPVKRRLRSI